MNTNFSPIIAGLGAHAAVRIIRETRVSADYRLMKYLPEINKTSFTVNQRTMQIVPTMAMPTRRSRPFAKGGTMRGNALKEDVIKLTNSIPMDEETRIELWEMMLRMEMSNDQMGMEAMQFLRDTAVQAQWDTAEYMRGMALSNGTLAWEFNGIVINVDYGVPADHKLATRTVASNTNYAGSQSSFWADMHSLQRVLDYRVRSFVTHPETYDDIVNNPANAVEVIDGDYEMGWFDLVKTKGDIDRQSGDKRDRVRLNIYGNEGKVIDPDNPDSTIKVPFITPGKVTAIAEAGKSGYRVGKGSAPVDLNEDEAVGYTHIAPTVEGDMKPGRWARLRVPDDEPYNLYAESVANIIPVLTAPDKIAIATTELSS